MSVPFFRNVMEEGDENENGDDLEEAMSNTKEEGDTASSTVSLSTRTTVANTNSSNVEVVASNKEDQPLRKSSQLSIHDFGDDAIRESKSSSDDDDEVWDTDDIELALLTPTRREQECNDVSVPSKSVDNDDPVTTEGDAEEAQAEKDTSPSGNATEQPPNFPPKLKRRSYSLPDIHTASALEDEMMINEARSKRRQSCSDHPMTPDNNTRIPLVVGGGGSSDSTPNRRVRFDSAGSQEDSFRRTTRAGLYHAEQSFHSVRTDITIGSRESTRLAKLRFEQEDVRHNWDKKAATKTAKFVRKKILMLRDDNDDDEDNNNNAATDNEGEEQKRFISRQVMRRPLKREEEELLRMIGLDAFVVLRFLKFMFGVFFWPCLLALITLIPLYVSANSKIGFYSTTIITLIGGSQAKYWFAILFEYLHFCYILRRLWIEWELFLPLRYDFLEHGDFQKEKYKEQYTMTCLVEYIPPSHKNDKSLFQFFDTLFPGQVKRAEVLLNTEHLRRLIKARLDHIVAYENVFAKMVHDRATYLRELQIYEQHPTMKRCCRGVIVKPREPSEPKKIVVHTVGRMDMHNVLVSPQTVTVKDPRTHFAREWHHQ